MCEARGSQLLGLCEGGKNDGGRIMIISCALQGPVGCDVRWCCERAGGVQGPVVCDVRWCCERAGGVRRPVGCDVRWCCERAGGVRGPVVCEARGSHQLRPVVCGEGGVNMHCFRTRKMI